MGWQDFLLIAFGGGNVIQFAQMFIERRKRRTENDGSQIENAGKLVDISADVAAQIREELARVSNRLTNAETQIQHLSQENFDLRSKLDAEREKRKNDLQKQAEHFETQIQKIVDTTNTQIDDCRSQLEATIVELQNVMIERDLWKQRHDKLAEQGGV